MDEILKQFEALVMHFAEQQAKSRRFETVARIAAQLYATGSYGMNQLGAIHDAISLYDGTVTAIAEEEKTKA